MKHRENDLPQSDTVQDPRSVPEVTALYQNTVSTRRNGQEQVSKNWETTHSWEAAQRSLQDKSRKMLISLRQLSRNAVLLEIKLSCAKRSGAEHGRRNGEQVGLE